MIWEAVYAGAFAFALYKWARLSFELSRRANHEGQNRSLKGTIAVLREQQVNLKARLAVALLEVPGLNKRLDIQGERIMLLRDRRAKWRTRFEESQRIAEQQNTLIGHLSAQIESLKKRGRDDLDSIHSLQIDLTKYRDGIKDHNAKLMVKAEALAKYGKHTTQDTSADGVTVTTTSEVMPGTVVGKMKYVPGIGWEPTLGGILQQRLGVISPTPLRYPR